MLLALRNFFKIFLLGKEYSKILAYLPIKVSTLILFCISERIFPIPSIA